MVLDLVIRDLPPGEPDVDIPDLVVVAAVDGRTDDVALNLDSFPDVGSTVFVLLKFEPGCADPVCVPPTLPVFNLGAAEGGPIFNKIFIWRFISTQ